MRFKRSQVSVCLIVCFISLTISDNDANKPTQTPSFPSCFCTASDISACGCDTKSIDYFNSHKIVPLLNDLIKQTYFKFYYINMKKKCPFWKEEGQCMSKDCSVDSCEPEKVPDGVRSRDNERLAAVTSNGNCVDDNNHGLGHLDTTITEADRRQFPKWHEYDASRSNNFCELDDDQMENCEYVDLSLNHERYTGYRGKGASQVWNSIYNENCFKSEPSEELKQYGLKQEMCLEKRVFYRLVSGFHTSISVQVAAGYLLVDGEKATFNDLATGSFGPNLERFKSQWDPSRVPEATERLRNLYFAYLLELRAIAKVAPYLMAEDFYTGDASDEQTKQLVLKLLGSVQSFKNHYDESPMFRGSEALDLKEQFRLRFLNISRIMDCVGCDRCKLWGKIQMSGMGTALKILFTNSPSSTESIIPPLRRSEIVSLFNAFARLSNSLVKLGRFRELIAQNGSG